MENKRKQKVNWWLIGFILAVFIGYLGSVKLYEHREAKAAAERHQNGGKIEVYKSQEVEALRKATEIGVLIDSLWTKAVERDSLTSEEVIERLNIIFNQNNSSK